MIVMTPAWSRAREGQPCGRGLPRLPGLVWLEPELWRKEIAEDVRFGPLPFPQHDAQEMCQVAGVAAVYALVLVSLVCVRAEKQDSEDWHLGLLRAWYGAPQKGSEAGSL